MGVATTHLSMREVLRLPDAPGKREPLDGEFILITACKTQPYGNGETGSASAGNGVEPLDVWIEMEQLGKRWLQPGVSVSWQKQPQGAPILAVEIVSPNNRADAMERRLPRTWKQEPRKSGSFSRRRAA